MRRTTSLLLICLLAAGCAPQFQSNITPIRAPTSYPASYDEAGFQIAFDVLSPAAQEEHFGVDMTDGDVLPVRIVIRNDSQHEYYVQAEQIFGRTANGDLYPAYRLDQSVARVRQSEIGEAMARGAFAGIVIGAAAGAAAGAAIGGAAGDAGQGAALGAAVGGTSGGISGAAGGADSISHAIKKELRKVDWGSRVVYPGHTLHGFLFLKSGVPYESIEALLYNVNKRENTRILVGLR